MLVCIAGCPSLDSLGEVAEDVEKTFLDFFQSKVTSGNYTLCRPPAQDTNPLIRHGDVSFNDLAMITNRMGAPVHRQLLSLITQGHRRGPDWRQGMRYNSMFHFPKTVQIKINSRQWLQVSLPQESTHDRSEARYSLCSTAYETSTTVQWPSHA